MRHRDIKPRQQYRARGVPFQGASSVVTVIQVYHMVPKNTRRPRWYAEVVDPEGRFHHVYVANIKPLMEMR